MCSVFGWRGWHWTCTVAQGAKQYSVCVCSIVHCACVCAQLRQCCHLCCGMDRMSLPVALGAAESSICLPQAVSAGLSYAQICGIISLGRNPAAPLLVGGVACVLANSAGNASNVEELVVCGRRCHRAWRRCVKHCASMQIQLFCLFAC